MEELVADAVVEADRNWYSHVWEVIPIVEGAGKVLMSYKGQGGPFFSVGHGIISLHEEQECGLQITYTYGSAEEVPGIVGEMLAQMAVFLDE